MILMQKNPLRGPLEGVGPENRDFFGPWNGNERSECHLGPKSQSQKYIDLRYIKIVLWPSFQFFGESIKNLQIMVITKFKKVLNKWYSSQGLGPRQGKADS